MTQTPAEPETLDHGRELQLRVTGMHCAGCAATVQRAIEARPGVRSANVSLLQELATISGDDLDADELIEAVRGRGFDAEAIHSTPAPSEIRSDIEFRQQRNERQWRFRAIVGLGVWVPIAILHWAVDARWVPWVLFIGASIVLATAGWGFYRSAFKAAAKRTTNMDTLISMGATTAYLFSLVVFISGLLDHDLGQPLYFTESAALLGIISLGHWLEARAGAKAGSAIRELLELQPDLAELLVEGGRTRNVSSAAVRPGDRLLIRPGARVPVDGLVVDGRSDVDESVVTGESLPVSKAAGDIVVAGSMNTIGRLTVEASVDGRHTTVSRIADMVQRAQASKADIQRLADRVASIFVPAVLTIAVITLLGWWIAGDFPAGVIATVTVLIISCPCALGLATPMAVMVGTGSASRRGILIKSAGALERAGRALRVVFDKTGTLTVGRPVLASVECTREDIDETRLLQLAASVEAASEHPLARAVVRAAHDRDIALRPVSDFHAIPGEGVQAAVDGRTVSVLRDQAADCRIMLDDEQVGAFRIIDELRPDAAWAIEELRDMQLEITMLSGDRRETATLIGERLALYPHEIKAQATPESKSQFIEELGAGTIMIGDGINDAAALACADLGIAMAGGTNIAIESADVVIPGDLVTAVPETIRLARQTLRTIKQNLFFAFIYNVVAIPVAALGLLGLYGPLIAAAAMGASDVTVIGNALRLKAKLSR